MLAVLVCLSVMQFGLEDESECIADAALIERVAEVRQVFEVLDTVAKHLLPRSLAGEH